MCSPRKSQSNGTTHRPLGVHVLTSGDEVGDGRVDDHGEEAEVESAGEATQGVTVCDERG